MTTRASPAGARGSAGSIRMPPDAAQPLQLRLDRASGDVLEVPGQGDQLPRDPNTLFVRPFDVPIKVANHELQARHVGFDNRLAVVRHVGVEDGLPAITVKNLHSKLPSGDGENVSCGRPSAHLHCKKS